jgi:predicted transcriptional regulator
MAITEIKVGSDLRTAIGEVSRAWKAADSGVPLPASDTLYFVDWSALCSVLTPKRYELIRHLRKEQSVASIRALARALGRDVKRVHEDVVALEEFGLITRNRETGILSTEIDEITSTIRFAA